MKRYLPLLLWNLSFKKWLTGIPQLPWQSIRSKLRLESLEDRCTPANLFWDPVVGGADEFSAVANWRQNKVGGPAAAAIPGANDRVNLTANANCVVDVNATINVLEISKGALFINSGTKLNVSSNAQGVGGSFDFSGGAVILTDNTSSLILDNAAGVWKDNATFASGGTSGLLEVTDGGSLLVAGTNVHNIDATLQVGSGAADDKGTITLDVGYTGNLAFGAKGKLDIKTGGKFYAFNEGEAELTFTAVNNVVLNAGSFKGVGIDGTLVSNANINNYTDQSIVSTSYGYKLAVKSISQPRGFTMIIWGRFAP